MTWIQTRTGARYDFAAANDHANDLDPSDIAWALAHTCRFGGHCRRFYSVAEHTVRALSVIEQVRPSLNAHERLRVEGMLLVHDAHEAYVGDVPRPLKPLLGESWAAIERAVEFEVRRWLAGELAATDPLWEVCDLVDRAMCRAEGRELMAWPDSLWTDQAIVEAPSVTFNLLDERWEPSHWAARWLAHYRDWKRRASVAACDETEIGNRAEDQGGRPLVDVVDEVELPEGGVS